MTHKRFRLPQSVPLWQLALPLLVLANLGCHWHNIFGWALTLGYFLIIPGYLLLTALRHNPNFKMEALGLSVGLSVALLLIGGLVLNTLHGLGLERPLSTGNILVMLDCTSVILSIAARRRKFGVQVRLPIGRWPDVERLVVGTVITLLPFLAVGGAFRLNNGASNILTMTMMGLIAILFVYMVARPKLASLYPYALFMIGVSILFGNSMRGWGITGHDIHHEFGVFMNALSQEHWVERTKQGDPYNACLSITILPTLLQKITNISPIYIYKAVYQILFASFLPVLLVLFRHFATKRVAFIGVFAFMTFPTFTNDLPFLNRQEIAFIFFILLLLVNFMKGTRRVKIALTVIFLISLILSHYSSSYVTLGLLLMAPLFYLIFKRKITQTDETHMPLLRVPMLLLALLCTFVWNAQVTASAGNLHNTIRDTVKNLVGPAGQRKGFNYSLFLPPTPKESQIQFSKYLARQPDARAIPKDTLPVTPVGHVIAAITDVHNLSKANVIFHAVLAKVLQLSVIVGAILLIKSRRKKFAAIPPYFMALVCVSLILLTMFAVLPQLSVDYDVTRLFQQSLIILWLPAVLLAESIFSFAKSKKLVLVAVMYAFLYLNLAGFVPQLTGAFQPQLPLNNSGVYYDYFYTHTSDELGIAWLTNERDKTQNIYLDTTSSSVPFKYPVIADFIYPDSPGYLYRDYTNTVIGKYRNIIGGVFIEYSNPSVTTGKNLVYSTGQTQIFLQQVKQ